MQGIRFGQITTKQLVDCLNSGKPVNVRDNRTDEEFTFTGVNVSEYGDPATLTFHLNTVEVDPETMEAFDKSSRILYRFLGAQVGDTYQAHVDGDVVRGPVKGDEKEGTIDPFKSDMVIRELDLVG